MPRTRSFINSFTSGVLDPLLHDRVDHDSYKSGVKTLDNLIPLPHGAATKRNGSLYVATTNNDSATRIQDFIVRNDLAAVIEMGEEYFRFYENNSYTGLTISTPYVEEEIPNIQVAQNGPIMYISHPDHAPAQLVRSTDGASYTLMDSIFSPPPIEEAGQAGTTTLTLSAVSGSVTITSSGPFFLEGDVDRELKQAAAIGTGVGTLLTVVSSTSATMRVSSPFTSVSLVSSEWFLTASPVVILSMTKSQPLGAFVNFITKKAVLGNTELIVNGEFTSDLSGWTDLSGGIVTSGTSDGNDTNTLFDAAATFITSGVRSGMRALDTTTPNEDQVVEVRTQNTLITSDDGADWSLLVNYEIHFTGTAVQEVSRCRLNGGTQGYGWIQQEILTQIGAAYQIIFDVAGTPLSYFAGSTADLADVMPEFSYPVGKQTIEFVASSASTFLNFRTNQDENSYLDNVSAKIYSVNAFRTTDVGKHIRVNSGIIEITDIVNAQSGTGIIRRALTDTLDALAGAWSLEENQWSLEKGYPNSVTLNGGRLVFGGSQNFPTRVWGSAISIYTDMASGSEAAQPYQFDLSASRADPLQWLIGERSLVTGTSSHEYTLRGEVSHVITPSSIDVSSPTAYGSTNLQPVRAPQAFFFVQRNKRRLYENVGIDDFGADDRQVADRSILIETLITSDIVSMAYQHTPKPILWIVLEEGLLLSLTYLREHVVAGWAFHPTTGTIKSVAVIPNPNGLSDQVWLLTERRSGTRYIERLSDTGHYYGGLQTDCTKVITNSPSSSIISGLEHLNGLTVSVLGDGVAHTRKVVVGGMITADGPATSFEVGVPMEVLLETLRPAVGTTPLTNLQLASVRIALSLMNTINLVVNGERIYFSTVDDMFGSPPALYTGLKELESIGWDTSATISVSQDLPYPVTIRGIFRDLEIEESTR